MFILKELNNAKLRKNYKCNETTDYFNRAGHNCYDDNNNIINTILIGIGLIVIFYLLFLLITKIKKRKKEKNNQKETKEIERNKIKK